MENAFEGKESSTGMKDERRFWWAIVTYCIGEMK